MAKKTTVNLSLIKQAVLAKMANKRQSTAHTKTRGEVSGGGRKPWRQKGTGRARAGSSRSPIWVGGGITFGPRSQRNFKVHLPKAMAKKAKEQLWQLVKAENRVISTESLHVKEPKTKLAVAMLNELGVSGKKTLLITEKLEAELVLATANIQGVDVTMLNQVSLLDLASYQKFVMEKSCFETIYGAEKPKAAPKSTKTKKETK